MAKKEYTYEEICRNIVAKKFAPVYIMMGDEPFFMDQITDLLLENVLEESERDFNQIIMYGADTDAASIINAARRFPMMSKYQLVVVREAQLIRDIELLSNYVKNPDVYKRQALILVIVGFFRELLGSGTLLGFQAVSYTHLYMECYLMAVSHLVIGKVPASRSDYFCPLVHHRSY